MTPVRFALPDIGAPSAVAFPAVHRHALANGTRVWFIPHTGVPAVTVSMVIDGGVAADPADRHGLASLVASLVTEGAGGKDAIAMADALARIGGHLAVESGADVSTVTLTTLTKHVETGLELMADVVRRPMFLPADFDRARDLRRSRLMQASRVPSTIADRALLQAVFADHPYGHGAFGTTRTLAAMSLDELRGHWAQTWGPSRATLLVSGDVAADRLEAAVAAAFGDWTSDARPPARLLVPEPNVERRILVVPRAGAPQSEVRVGHHGPPRRTPDYHALLTLNALLGGQFTSRLNRNLRETRAITYGVRSSFDMRRVGGLFSVDASVQADATADAVAEILRECREVTAEAPIQPDELAQAKASLTRGYARHFETAAHLVRAMAQLATHDLDPDVFDQFVPAVERLDADTVMQAARRAILPDQAAIVVVGDVDRIGPSLERVGRVVVPAQVEF
jgi:zinc protease